MLFAHMAGLWGQNKDGKQCKAGKKYQNLKVSRWYFWLKYSFMAFPVYFLVLPFGLLDGDMWPLRLRTTWDARFRHDLRWPHGPDDPDDFHTGGVSTPSEWRSFSHADEPYTNKNPIYTYLLMVVWDEIILSNDVGRPGTVGQTRGHFFFFGFLRWWPTTQWIFSRTLDLEYAGGKVEVGGTETPLIKGTFVFWHTGNKTIKNFLCAMELGAKCISMLVLK